MRLSTFSALSRDLEHKVLFKYFGNVAAIILPQLRQVVPVISTACLDFRKKGDQLSFATTLHCNAFKRISTTQVYFCSWTGLKLNCGLKFVGFLFLKRLPHQFESGWQRYGGRNIEEELTTRGFLIILLFLINFRTLRRFEEWDKKCFYKCAAI